MNMDDLTLYGAIALLGVGIAIKIYLKIKPKLNAALADGQLTLDEAIDLAETAIEIGEEVKALPSYSALKRMRKSEILNLCAKHGITATGTKDELITLLKEQVK